MPIPRYSPAAVVCPELARIRPSPASANRYAAAGRPAGRRPARRGHRPARAEAGRRRPRAARRSCGRRRSPRKDDWIDREAGSGPTPRRQCPGVRDGIVRRGRFEAATPRGDGPGANRASVGDRRDSGVDHHQRRGTQVAEFPPGGGPRADRCAPADIERPSARRTGVRTPSRWRGAANSASPTNQPYRSMAGWGATESAGASRRPAPAIDVRRPGWPRGRRRSPRQGVRHRRTRRRSPGDRAGAGPAGPAMPARRGAGSSRPRSGG